METELLSAFERSCMEAEEIFIQPDRFNFDKYLQFSAIDKTAPSVMSKQSIRFISTSRLQPRVRASMPASVMYLQCCSVMETRCGQVSARLCIVRSVTLMHLLRFKYS